VVFTGIIPVAKDEDGLAAILGHGLSSRFGARSMLIRGTEIAHVVARHNAERYSSMKVLLGFATLLEVLRSRRRNREVFDNIPP
jgi:Zn-dependent protease with chaperone function